jgi:hypothetical protein
MKEQFVTYEIALKLKELDFNEECLCTYAVNGRRFQRNPSNNMAGEEIEEPYTWKNSLIHKSVMTAPLWQQVIDWFREKHNIIIEVWFDYTQININEFLWIYEIYVNNNQHDHDGSWYDNFNECREFAILKAIELLNNDKSKR